MLPPVKQSPAEQLDNVPVLTVTVPEAGAKSTSSKEAVIPNVFVAVAEPDVLALVPSLPPNAKSRLSASAIVGNARANSANKITRLMSLLRISIPCGETTNLCVRTFMALRWGRVLSLVSARVRLLLSTWVTKVHDPW